LSAITEFSWSDLDKSRIPRARWMAPRTRTEAAYSQMQASSTVAGLLAHFVRTAAVCVHLTAYLASKEFSYTLTTFQRLRPGIPANAVLTVSECLFAFSLPTECNFCSLRLKCWPVKMVKLSLQQAVQAYRVVRLQGSQIFQTVGSQMAVKLSTLRAGRALSPRMLFCDTHLC
jgi:hypothetical protein